MSSTYVVELTPPGRGAVAVVLVTGPEGVTVVDQLFTAGSGRPIRDSPVGRICVGHWGAKNGEELIVCRRGEDEVEIHCHGGHAAVAAVVSALVAKGARSIPWREWLERIPAIASVQPASSPQRVVNRRDRVANAAHIALADAITERTALILLDQMNGALSKAIAAVFKSVEGRDWPRAAHSLDAMLLHREVGLHLTEPWRVVLTGPPNVGKSSLINALMGFQRAIVSHSPGTTRDVVTATTAIDGWPVLLADTAGLRETRDELEAAGVKLAREALSVADLAIVVDDASNPMTESIPLALLLPPQVICVWNKVDLLAVTNVVDGVTPSRGDPNSASCLKTISTSAVMGVGIPELIAAIGASLVPNPPRPGDAVPFTSSQVEALVIARNAVERQNAAAAVEALSSVLAGS